MSFKRLDPEDFTFGIDSISAPAWSNFTASLTSLYTSSLQQDSSNGQYYIDVYNLDPTVNENAEIQFSITYGDPKGSGSLWYSPVNPGISPSKTVYGQFVNLLLGEDEGASFDFGESTTTEAFFAIIINRTRYKQSILPGSLQIKGLGATPSVYITDNSLLSSSLSYTPAGRRYALGSGSFGDGAPFRGLVSYGYLYPDIGVILLNPEAFNSTVQSNAWKRDSDENMNNPERLRQYITEFSLQSQETITSNYIFCRARNNEFNFSTQNNFISSTRNITGSSNAINNDFIKTPSTYITSVGLYNDNNELLAVAKLSKPLKKDFTTEALIRVKLDF
jgi:hypothetical protein